jgi:hypothetical protein
MKSFISWSFEHFDQICESFSLWRAISVRLSLAVSPATPNSRVGARTSESAFSQSGVGGRTFSPSQDGSLDGIIAQLTREHGGNVQDRGIVDITAKSVKSPHVPKFAADLESENCFDSTNSPDQWLCYDFRTRRVRPTHYSIQPYFSNYYLRSWVLEGSNDGSSWTVLDSQKDNSLMNLSHPIGTFAVSQSTDWRFLRLRQTGKNAKGDHYLVITAFELFGQLIE